jgi:hypothetical protein
VLIDIEPRVRARVVELVEQVGEAEFRRGVAQFTGWPVGSMGIEDVIGLYVMARRGRVHRPEVSRDVARRHMALPGRTDDDAGFCGADGERITPEEWVARRTERL